jgi:hypothetical protein
MKKSILFTPANDSVIHQLRDNLKSSSSKVFSFSPNSNEKLEAVALATIGYFNGRQQWKAEAEIAPISLQSIVNNYNETTLETLAVHADPLVRALATGLQASLKSSFVLIYDDSDLEGADYSDILSESDKRNVIKLIQHNYDNCDGVSEDSISHAIQMVVDEKTFVSDDYGVIGKIDGQWVNENGDVFVIDSESIGDDGEMGTWFYPAGKPLSYEYGIKAGTHGEWQSSAE